MARLIALDPIQHDGRAYAPGEQLDVKDQAQSEALVAVGAAQPAPGGKAKAAPPAADDEAV